MRYLNKKIVSPIVAGAMATTLLAPPCNSRKQRSRDITDHG